MGDSCLLARTAATKVDNSPQNYTDKRLGFPAVFLDRDGVLNQDKGYVFRMEDLEVCKGVAQGLARLASRAFMLVVVSNQSGIARGFFNIQDTTLFHQELNRQLKSLGAPEIQVFLFCPHLPDGIVPEYSVTCPCRKPSPGMVLAAAHRFNIDLASSFLIGDRWTDIQTAIHGNIRGIQIRSAEHPTPHPLAWASVDHFEEAVDKILGFGHLNAKAL